MGRTLFLNLKRLAGNRMLILLPVLAPALLLLAFGSVIAPVYFSGGMEVFQVAVLNEDDNPLTGAIIEGMVADEAANGLISVRFVKTLPAGMDMIEEGAAAMVTIPPGFQETMQRGGQSRIGFYPNPDKPLEAMLLQEVLTSGIRLVNDAQRGVNALYNTLLDHGLSHSEAAQIYNDTARYFMSQALDRTEAVEVAGTLSPLGRLLPVEYYAAALLSVFLFFGALGLSALTAQDKENNILDRDLCAGKGPFSFVLSRIAAGAALVALQGIPALGLVLLFSSGGFFYTGRAALVIPALLLFAWVVSAGGVGAGMLFRSRDATVKTVFLILCALAVAGGAVIPVSGLGVFSRIVPYTVFNASMRLFSNTLFFYDGADCIQSALVLALYAVLFTWGAYLAARRQA